MGGVGILRLQHRCAKAGGAWKKGHRERGDCFFFFSVCIAEGKRVTELKALVSLQVRQAAPPEGPGCSVSCGSAER